MRIHILFITALAYSACAFADERETKYLTMMEKFLNTSSLFYSRISPEIAAQIKPAMMPPEASKVAECVVDKARADGVLEQFDESLAISDSFTDYIVKTPNLTVSTIGQDKRFVELQSRMLEERFERLQVHAKECGVLEMNQKITKTMGIFEAMRSARE